MVIEKKEDLSKSLNPLNELRLQEIQDPSASVKMITGYKMAFSTMLFSKEYSGYIIKRQSTLRPNLRDESGGF